jgi:hypothetical protein
LFSKEPIALEDYAISYGVKEASMYLEDVEKHNRVFVGKVGRFCPMLPGYGSLLLRVSDDGSSVSHVAGTKGYLWARYSDVVRLGLENQIDKDYYRAMTDGVIKQMASVGDISGFFDE